MVRWSTEARVIFLSQSPAWQVRRLPLGIAVGREQSPHLLRLEVLEAEADTYLTNEKELRSVFFAENLLRKDFLCFFNADPGSGGELGSSVQPDSFSPSHTTSSCPHLLLRNGPCEPQGREG